MVALASDIVSNRGGQRISGRKPMRHPRATMVDLLPSIGVEEASARMLISPAAAREIFTRAAAPVSRERLAWGAPIPVPVSRLAVAVVVRYEARLLKRGGTAIAVAALIDEGNAPIEPRLVQAGVDADGALSWLEHAAKLLLGAAEFARVIELIKGARKIDWEGRSDVVFS